MTEEPSFDKAPFVRKHLDTTDDIITLRLNDEERAQLNDVKETLQLDADGTALKIALDVAQNVILGTVGKKTMQYLCSQRRVRPKAKILKNLQNVIQNNEVL
ncbi:hypothetical protein HY485_01010 [Candidatus Woesearchaeota archaeon]|nr:hypothetical protein [Candidatus Woesearchaeota archaeon]